MVNNILGAPCIFVHPSIVLCRRFSCNPALNPRGRLNRPPSQATEVQRQEFARLLSEMCPGAREHKDLKRKLSERGSVAEIEDNPDVAKDAGEML